MGLDFDQLFPNRFLKAGEFKGRDVCLTISAVELEDLPADGGKVDTKGILRFKETKKALVLNKTNGLCIRAMFGRDTGEWVGKKVVLFPAKVDFGDSDIAVRVRGSPDLEADLTFELKLARKKPRPVTMKKTGAKAAPPPEPEPAEPNPFTPEPGEGG